MESDSNGFARTNSLVDWARSNGAILHEEVEIFISETYGTALRVKNSCPSNGIQTKTSVVSCPFKLSLSYLNAVGKFPDLRARSILFPPEIFESLEPHIIGNFFLVQQYLTVDRSYWAAYIKSLPQPDEVGQINTPPYYSNEEMKWLRGTSLETATKNRIATWILEWEKGVSILQRSPELNYLHGKWTFGLYKWAATIFSSRSFVSRLIPKEIFGEHHEPQMRDDDDSSCPVLFPLVDIANHSPQAQVTWFSNVQGPNKNLSIIVESDIPAGDQIFNNYAPKSNSELLLGYGFVIPGNDEVTISLKPLPEELMAIRIRQHCYQGYMISPEKHTYYVRNRPYSPHSRMKSLPELRVFEVGCVDTLALCISNHREKAFLKNEPRYCPEETSAASLDGYMARNTLHIMSVLTDKLQSGLDEILHAGSDLDQPKTSAQRASMTYRQGQISVLKDVISLLEKALDLFLSSHNFCGHTLIPSRKDGVRLPATANLMPLDCAFSWLKSNQVILWAEAVAIVRGELDVEPQELGAGPLDYIEIIDGDWEFTLWCLWIFLVLSPSAEKLSTFQDDPVRIWIRQIISIYKPTITSTFTYFHGDSDELSTLETMIGRLSSCSMDQDLLNLASLIVQEETFPVNAPIAVGDVTRRRQRVFCLSKLEI